MLENFWKIVRTTVLTLGALLGFVAVIELLQAYHLLRGLHPVLGFLFFMVLLLGVAWLVAYYLVSLKRYPPVLIAPSHKDLASAGHGEVRAYSRYLARLAGRLAGNSLLPEEDIKRLRQSAEVWRAMLSAKDATLATLQEQVRRCEADVLQPAMDRLKERADREVRTCVRDVMLAVTLSPWRSVDLMVVLYRNIRMVVRVTQIYTGHPRLREQGLILRDVIGIVATVNFLNYGSKLFQHLASGVPVLGRFADDVAQGVGAGLMTSLAGHAAVERCQAFRGWSEAEARDSFRHKLKLFISDVKGIMTNDIWPLLKKPVEARAALEAGRSDMIGHTGDDILTAIDASSETMDTFDFQPAAVEAGIVSTSAIIRDAVVSGCRVGWRAARVGGARSARFLAHASAVGATELARGIRKGSVVLWSASQAGAGKARAAWRKRRAEAAAEPPPSARQGGTDQGDSIG